jgi:general secretion pathway protein L
VSDVVGIAPREGRLDVVAVRRGIRGARVVAAFSVPADGEAATALRLRLREAGVRARRAHVGLPRRSVVAKAVELPLVPGADFRRMVGFELERHLPFPASEAVFDFELLDVTPGRPARVLLVAVERRLEERVRTLLRDAGLVPRHVGVAIHSLARLAAPATRPGRLVLWLEEAEAELAVVANGRIVASRGFPLPADGEARARALGDEIERTVGSLGEGDRAGLAEIVVGGVPAPAGAWAGLPVRRAPDPADAVGGAPEASRPALAIALERPGRGRPSASLVADALRPRPFPWPLATTAALGLATLLLAAAIPAVTLWRESRTLADLDREIARLAPAVQGAERLAADVERARRELTALREFELQGLRALPLLRELTEALPGDVWLTSFTADRNGVELAGFANSASQLIALLEASPRLERVEFTSPVTKGRDREQFRLKASWEGRGGRR